MTDTPDLDALRESGALASARTVDDHCCYCWSPGHRCPQLALCENHARGSRAEKADAYRARIESLKNKRDELDGENRGLREHIDHYMAAHADAIRAERDALRATVERVRDAIHHALANQVVFGPDDSESVLAFKACTNSGISKTADAIRAALEDA